MLIGILTGMVIGQVQGRFLHGKRVTNNNLQPLGNLHRVPQSLRRVQHELSSSARDRHGSWIHTQTGETQREQSQLVTEAAWGRALLSSHFFNLGRSWIIDSEVREQQGGCGREGEKHHGHHPTAGFQCEAEPGWEGERQGQGQQSD